MLIVGPAENLSIADGRFAREVEDQRGGDGRNQQFQAAETGLPRLAATEPQILAADRGAPAPRIDNRLKAKAGKSIGQLVQASFDVLAKLQAGLRVHALQFLFRNGSLGLLLRPGIAQALASLYRSFESVLKIHGQLSLWNLFSGR